MRRKRVRPYGEEIDEDVYAVGRDWPETSHEAMLKVVGRTGSYRRRFYDFIYHRGMNGATSSECAAEFGMLEGDQHSSYSATCSTLKHDGFIVWDSPRKRVNHKGNLTEVYLARPVWEEKMGRNDHRTHQAVRFVRR